MADKLVLRGTPSADTSSETALSEEGVRQALARLGRGASQEASEERRPDQGREAQDPFRQLGGGQGGQRRTSAAPMHKLKRPAFVQDGDVVVEYAGRERPHHDGGDQGRADPGRTALDMLRDEVARERRAREEAERGLNETKLALQGLQTRLAHLELDLNEARSAARAALEEAATVAAEHAQAAKPVTAEPAKAAAPVEAEPEANAAAERPAALRVPKVRRQQAMPRISTREPQPVKWWIKSKG